MPTAPEPVRCVFSQTVDLNPGVERWRARVRHLRSHALLRVSLDDLSTVLFPSDCRVCGELLVRASRVPVCDACRNLLIPQTFSMCAICGEALGFESARLEDAPLCRICRFSPPPFAQAVAFGQYTGALREMVGLFKFERVAVLSRLLGEKLAEEIRQMPGLSRSAVVVPVPLFHAKLAERGYNQSRLLAVAAVRVLNNRYGFRLQVIDALTRVKTTESQYLLTPRQRRLNLRGAFAVRTKRLVSGKDILLIDDIYTTGATARECTRALLRAGAASVRVATLARAQRDVPVLWSGAKFAVPQGAALGHGSLATDSV